MTKKNLNKVKFAIFILVIVAAISVAIVNWHEIKNINMDRVLTFIEEEGAFSIVIYLLIFVIKPFLIIIPTNLIAIMGGTLFGPIKGFLLTMVGFFITGTIAFYISRLLGRDFVEGLLGKKFIKLDKNMEEKGFKILFFLRLPPVIPFDPLSYACGLTKIKYRDFILASLFGVVPETICYSIMGKNFHNPLSPQFIIPIALVTLAALFSAKFLKFEKKQLENEEIN